MESQQTSEVERTENGFRFSRILNAPRALVYKMWTEAEHFKLWWGPHTYTNTCTMDARIGGHYTVTMISPEGEHNPLRGEFLELVPDEKIVMTMDTTGHAPAWHGIVNAARGLPADAPAVSLLTTITLEDWEGKTKITIAQQFENNIDRDAFLQLGSVIGWGQSLVKMDNLLATLSTERGFIHSRTVSAPPALVWQVWSDPVHLAKWWGPNGFTNTIASLDLRTGGEWLYTMHGPDGTDYPNWMRFREVVPQVRITYDHGSFPNDPEAFQGEITFEAVGESQTQITLRITMATVELRDGMFKFGVFEGGDQTLSRLDAYVQQM